MRNFGIVVGLLACLASLASATFFGHRTAHCETAQREHGYCTPVYLCRQLMNNLSAGAESYNQILFPTECNANANGDGLNVCCTDSGRPIKKPLGGRLLPRKCGQTLSVRKREGEQVAVNEFSWVVRIEKIPNNKVDYGALACSGALISKRYVLTTASCVKSLTPSSEFRVIVSLCDIRGPPCRALAVGIEQIVSHEKFGAADNGIYRDNIALVRLDADVALSRSLMPICLPNDKTEIPDDPELATAFYNSTLTPVAPVKERLELTAYNKNLCDTKYREKSVDLGTDQQCAIGVDSERKCSRNAGAPIMATDFNDAWYLIGLASFSGGCGSDLPEVYTDLKQYLPWITQRLY